MDLTLAIAKQLAKIVPNATIYRENREQGFTEPSFYIYEINAKSRANLMDFQMRGHTFCVTWFPNTEDSDIGPRQQCEDMREKLLDGFDFLDDLSFQVLDKEAEISQEALILTFRLRYRVVKEKEGVLLENLTTKGDVKRA